MKKFCYIILAGLMLTAFASCNKQSLPEGELQPAKGIPMELEATIGGPQTKVEFYADVAIGFISQWLDRGMQMPKEITEERILRVMDNSVESILARFEI